MRAIVLNDTRAEDHIGCQLVIRNLMRQCGRAGIDVVTSVPNSLQNDLPCVQSRIHEFELLVVNGEGTLHHDRPKAVSLCQAARFAAQRGKKVVLINTVWQHNEQLNHFLPYFDLISCRESRSLAAIQSAGHQARVVPDLVFDTGPVEPPAVVRTTRNTVVIDSVDRRTTLRWAWRALFRRYGMLVMHPVNHERLARRPLLLWGLPQRSGAPLEVLGLDFASQLGAYSHVISGRFHGCCLAMLLGIPVLGLPSNTHKVEGLFDDAGLGRMAMVRRGGRHEVDERFRYVEALQYRVRQYVAGAGQQISNLFDEIVRVARGERAA